MDDMKEVRLDKVKWRYAISVYPVEDVHIYM